MAWAPYFGVVVTIMRRLARVAQDLRTVNPWPTANFIAPVTVEQPALLYAPYELLGPARILAMYELLGPARVLDTSRKVDKISANVLASPGGEFDGADPAQRRASPNDT